MSKSRRNHFTGSIRSKGRCWEARIRVPGHDGQIYRNIGVRKDIDPVAGLSKREAEEKLREFIASYRPQRPERSKATFDALCSLFLVHKEGQVLAPASLAAIRSTIRVHLRPEFGPRLADSITAEDLEVFQAKKLREASPKSVRNWMSVLHSILEYGVKKRLLPRNVAKEVEKVKARRKKDIIVLSTAEIRAIRDVLATDDALSRQDSLMILVAARSGLRQGELIALRWKDIDWANGWIRVVSSFDRVSRKAKDPKGYEARALPLTNEVTKALMEHFKHSRRNRESDLVFPHPATGQELDGTKLTKRFQGAIVKSGVRETITKARRTSRGRSKEIQWTAIVWHDLRHAFATFCMAQGIPQATVEQWVGHKDIETLRLYLHHVPGGFELDLLNQAIERDNQAALNVPSRSDQTPSDAVGAEQD